MKRLLSELRDVFFLIPRRLIDISRRSHRDNRILQGRILQRRDESTVRPLITHYLGIDRIKSLKFITHGLESLIAEVDDTWVFKFPTGIWPAINLMKEERVLRFLQGRLSLRIPSLDIPKEGYLFSCHRKVSGDPVFFDDYAKFDDATKNMFAEDIAHFFADLHQIEPAHAAGLNIGKVSTWMSSEKFARVRRLLPSNYQLELCELQAQIEAENAKTITEVFGHFDCDGSNIAFDYAAGRLVGVFDFADATIGDLHKDLQSITKISYDCARRVVDRYRELTGRTVDMDRVRLFGVECQLSALLFCADRDGEIAIEHFLTWYERLKIDHAMIPSEHSPKSN